MAALPITIRQGSRGSTVVAWQKILGVKADGIFGPGTKKATQAWQTKHGLTADGIVGPNTWGRAKSIMVEPDLTIDAVAKKTLTAAKAETPKPIKVPAVSKPVPIPSNTPTLRKGSKGEAVKRWQTIVGVKADGKFGSGTHQATVSWQRAHKLKPDGIVGKLTWQAAKDYQAKKPVLLAQAPKAAAKAAAEAKVITLKPVEVTVTKPKAKPAPALKEAISNVIPLRKGVDTVKTTMKVDTAKAVAKWKLLPTWQKWAAGAAVSVAALLGISRLRK